jgi:hypothetical protein
MMRKNFGVTAAFGIGSTKELPCTDKDLILNETGGRPRKGASRTLQSHSETIAPAVALGFRPSNQII